MHACHVMDSRDVAVRRATSGSVGTVRSGASRITTHATTAYTARMTAVIRNGEDEPREVTSFTVVSALIAVPPIPIPKIPIASPRRLGGNQIGRASCRE